MSQASNPSTANAAPARSARSYTALAVAGALVAVGVALVSLRTAGNAVPASGGKAFFTVDDGKTWFADDAEKIPPFDKEGKQAVRAFVFRCPDGTMFVNSLQRFKPDAKQVLEEQAKPNPNRKGGPAVSEIPAALVAGREVKRPGDAQWIAGDQFRAASQVMTVKCPAGGTDAVEVQP